MSEYVTPRIITGIWTALSKQEPVLPGRGVGNIYKDAVASGWASYIRVESLLLETDPRLLGFGGLSVREILSAYDIPSQWTYRRPRRGETGGFGIEQVSATDLARLLILMEATGFAIDPAPLCELLRPSLRSKEHLTGAEIAVWWQAKEQHRSKPQVIATSRETAWGTPMETVNTAGGYRADLFRDAAGQPTAVMVTAPKWRPTRSIRFAA